MDAKLEDRQKAMEEFKEKLKAMHLTPEQAAQILESMNAAELRYIQQNKKKPTERPKRGIPDW
jgi:ribonuclease BN (tRNA processing enzyme)